MQRIIPALLLMSSMLFCKTEQKKLTPQVKNDATEVKPPEKKEQNRYVVDESTGLKKNKEWKTSLKEGWLDDSSAQALISTVTGNGAAKEKQLKEARERLAWLLLINSYDLQRADMALAEKLARSNLFKNFGKEEIFEQVEDNKLFIIVKRSNPSLKAEWKAIKEKIEKKEPRLTALRKR